MDEWRKHVQWQGDRIRTLEAQLTSPADERDARRRELELERRRTRALEERLQATQTAHAEVHRRSEEAERPPAGPTGSRRRSISPRTRPHCSGRRAVARSPRSNPATWPLRDASGTGPRRRPAWPARRSRPSQKRPRAISYLTWTSGRFWIAGRSNDTVAGLAEPVRPLADGPARGTPDPAWDEVIRSELADGGVVGELRFATMCLHRDRSTRPQCGLADFSQRPDHWGGGHVRPACPITPRVGSENPLTTRCQTLCFRPTLKSPSGRTCRPNIWLINSAAAT